MKHEINPDWVAAPMEIFFWRVVYTRRRGVKPSKLRRRIRYLVQRNLCFCQPHE